MRKWEFPVQTTEYKGPIQKARVLIELDGKIVGGHQMDKPVLTVGRLSGNDVQVPSQRVSRLHAKIRWENGVWVIEDAESLNGLVYQGHMVERHILSNGDRIYIAPTAVLLFELLPNIHEATETPNISIEKITEVDHREPSKPLVLFVGRQREQQLYEDFISRVTPWVLIITGLGGIGKTTLLHRLAEYTLSESTQLKTGVVTLDFANEELRNDPLKLLDRLTTETAPFCDVLQIDSDFKAVLQQNIDQLAQLSKERTQPGVSESEDPALREIHHQMRELATEAFYTQIKAFRLNRLVVMLDTCEWLNEPEGIEVGQWVLNELVPGLHKRIRQQGRPCHVVMVSRLQLKLDVINGRDQQRLTLPMLGKAEVDQYLEQMGMQDADLRQRVFEVTHGLALCVSIIGDFWQQREAQKEPFTIADLPELKLQEFSEIALMQFTNERVLKQLKSPFKELTRYGVILRSFDLPFLRNVFPELLPENEALEIFNQLIRYPYIESRGNYRYTFHELLREALSEVAQKEESEAWKVYHKLALDYLTKVSPHSPDRYYHLLAYDEKQGLVEWQQTIKEAREKGKREFSGALLQASLDVALNLSPMAQAEISYEQGRFNSYGLQWEEALKSYNEGLISFKEVEDYSGQAKVLQAIGDVQRTLEKQDDALASYGQALALYRKVGDQLGEARSCQALGDVQRLCNGLDAALLMYEQCLVIFQKLKDKSEEAKVLEAMGEVQRLRNALDAALLRYEQALALYQEEKDLLKRAKVLKAMGDVQCLRQERNAALESYEQALAIFGELKEPAEEANVRRAIDDILQPLNEHGVLLESGGNVKQTDRTSVVVETPTPNQLPAYKPNQHPYGNPIPTSSSSKVILTQQSGYEQLSKPLQSSPVDRRPQKRQGFFGGRTIMLVGLAALLIIAGGIGAFLVSGINKSAAINSNSNATATANTALGMSAHNSTPNAASGMATQTSIANNLSDVLATGKLVLNDPLSDNSGNNKWFEGGTSTGACVFTGGSYHVFALQKGSTIYCPASATNFSNCAYEVQMTILKGDLGGLIFRLGTNQNFYSFGINIDGSYILSIRDNTNGFRALNGGNSSAINIGLGQSNLIAIVVSNHKIELYINNKFIDSAINDTYTSGQIGLFAAASQNQTEVMFSNAIVWTL